MLRCYSQTDENEEIYEKVKLHRVKRSGIKLRALLELAVFVAILCTLVVSLTVDKRHVHDELVHAFSSVHHRKELSPTKKVLYFVHGLKKNVQVFIWFSLVLVAWIFLFEEDNKHSHPIGTSACRRSRERVGCKPKRGHLSFMSTEDGSVKGKKVLDMGKVHKMKQEKVSALAMRVLIEAVRASGLSTISSTLDECINRRGKHDKEITNEMEAVAAAYDIFNNVAQPNRNYINEDDLLRFMIKEEVDLVLPLIEGTETGKITRKAFIEWVVDKLIAGVLTIITFIIWLILLDIASTKFLLVFSSQFVGLAFMIGSTCKNIFESFVFVMHPYDVGDRCVVDGVMLLVEEIHSLTTVFLKIDNEKVFYPNAVLITKSISNFYRSPDMGDFIELSHCIFNTRCENSHFQEKNWRNPHHWYPEPMLMVKAIENVNKLKMNLLVQHTINFQNFGEKNLRRTELFIAIKRVLEELEIDYTLLPQDVHLTSHK
ncbi:hypothetical protein F2Q68_00002090 [Brassica cretica]|uniref:Mechanosensitive ion channel MscS domain-containing protein n=1 Tax=Brassica cretica TaxID=69181 RepID=A0A8S9JCF5_BRACR|nr:hypothetical protein F2Q68_00002090 [Brassica cretica]